jgi:hypothetical protein
VPTEATASRGRQESGVRKKAGCWILDAGSWMLDTGCWILDAGFWSLEPRSWILDAGSLILDACGLILDTESGERITHPTFGCGSGCHLIKTNKPAICSLIRETLVWHCEFPSSIRSAPTAMRANLGSRSSRCSLLWQKICCTDQARSRGPAPS